MSSDQKVPKCPECGHAEVYSRSSQRPAPFEAEGEGRWRCGDCGATFDEPEMVARGRGGGPSTGLAGKLAQEDFNPEIGGGESA